MAKYNLPDTYVEEAKEFERLKLLGATRTSTGNLSFTSSSSTVVYNSTTGQTGILNQLQTVLNSYLVSATDLIIATQVEAETGSDDTKIMTPLKVKESINANAVTPSMKATNAQAQAGIDDTNYMTAAKVLAEMSAKLGYKYTIVYGDYVGNTASSRDINIGFTPELLLITQGGSMNVWYAPNSVNWCKGGMVTTSNSMPGLIEIITNGFRVYYNGSDSRGEKTNANYGTYSYIAIKKEAIV